MLIFFVVVTGFLRLSQHFQEPVMEWFGLDDGAIPGDAPPWYFITRDFATGVCALGALLLTLVVAAITWQRWSNLSGIMVWMSLITYGGDIARSWIISQACPGILDGQRITNRWPTFESYLRDPGIARARMFIGMGALVIAIVLPLADRYVRSRLNRTTPRPQHDQEGEQVVAPNGP